MKNKQTTNNMEKVEIKIDTLIEIVDANKDNDATYITEILDILSDAGFIYHPKKNAWFSLYKKTE